MKQTIVIKCGGSSLDELSAQFFENIQILKNDGWKIVIVHGGGPAIKQMLDKMNMTFEFIDGLRKTTKEMIDLIEMVLSGQINSKLTRHVNSFNLPAVGISGSDLQLLEAKPINLKKYGLVGKIINVNTAYLESLLEQNIIPIISPVAVDRKQNVYNVNADTVAGAIAEALKAESLIFVTDVPGLLKNDLLLEQVTIDEIETMIQTGDIYGGMLPKVKAAMNGLSKNVSKIMIVNGKQSELTAENMLKGTTILQGENK